MMRFDLYPPSPQNGDTVTVTPIMMARSTFEGICALCVFREFHLGPVIQGLLKPSTRESAFVALFHRMAGVLMSLQKLNSGAHVQSIASAARTLFELGMDAVLLHDDTSEAGVRRFISFSEVDRFRVARKTAEFYATRPVPPDVSVDEMKKASSDAVREARIEGMLKDLWGLTRNKVGALTWPGHWTNLNAWDRAERAGPDWQDRYVNSYYRFSWHVHAGAVNIAGLPAYAFDIFASEAHTLAYRVTLDAWRILGEEIPLEQGMQGWSSQLEFLEHVAGFALDDEKRVALGGPSQFKFKYLEPTEAAYLGPVAGAP